MMLMQSVEKTDDSVNAKCSKIDDDNNMRRKFNHSGFTMLILLSSNERKNWKRIIKSRHV